jgi:hypothetical protein
MTLAPHHPARPTSRALTDRLETLAEDAYYRNLVQGSRPVRAAVLAVLADLRDAGLLPILGPTPPRPAPIGVRRTADGLRVQVDVTEPALGLLGQVADALADDPEHTIALLHDLAERRGQYKAAVDALPMGGTEYGTDRAEAAMDAALDEAVTAIVAHDLTVDLDPGPAQTLATELDHATRSTLATRLHTTPSTGTAAR